MFGLETKVATRVRRFSSLLIPSIGFDIGKRRRLVCGNPNTVKLSATLVST